MRENAAVVARLLTAPRNVVSSIKHEDSQDVTLSGFHSSLSLSYPDSIDYVLHCHRPQSVLPMGRRFRRWPLAFSTPPHVVRPG